VLLRFISERPIHDPQVVPARRQHGLTALVKAKRASAFCDDDLDRRVQARKPEKIDSSTSDVLPAATVTVRWTVPALLLSSIV